MTRSEMITKLNEGYAKERQRAQRERDERIDRAVLRDPRIGELLSMNTELFHQSAARMTAEKKDIQAIVADVKRRSAAIAGELAKRLDALGLAPDEFELRYTCADCQDTGYTGELRNVMCNCMRQKLLEMICEDQNMTGLDRQNFGVFDLSVFSDAREENQPYSQRQAMEAVRDRCLRYADTYPNTEKPNLLLMGESGLGKTFLLNCVAERIVSRGHVAVRVTAFRMQEAMRKRHIGAFDDNDAFDEMVNCEILFIDDLGTEPMMRNITIEYLFTLLNERMNARRHTVIATNLTMSDLRERYNERVASRLLDHTNTEIYRLIGRDLRQRKL